MRSEEEIENDGALQNSAWPHFYFKVINTKEGDRIFFCDISGLSRTIYDGAEIYLCDENSAKKIGLINHKIVLLFSLKWMNDLILCDELSSLHERPEVMNSIEKTARITSDWLASPGDNLLEEAGELLGLIDYMLSGEESIKMGYAVYKLLEVAATVLFVLLNPEMSHESIYISSIHESIMPSDQAEGTYAKQGAYILHWLSGPDQLFFI